MSRFAKLQLIGPAVLFAALLGADSAAYALAMFPSSAALWRINLELFGIFQKADYVLSAYVDVAYFQLLFVGLPLVVMAGCGLASRRVLLLAVVSNLSFVYASFLLCSWYLCEQSWRQASLTVTSLMRHGVLAGPNLWVIGVLLGASLLSFVVSHMSYLRVCSADRNVVPLLSVTGPSDPCRGGAAANRVD